MTLDEAKKINGSLSALSHVISALADGKAHVAGAATRRYGSFTSEEQYSSGARAVPQLEADPRPARVARRHEMSRDRLRDSSERLMSRVGSHLLL